MRTKRLFQTYIHEEPIDLLHRPTGDLPDAEVDVRQRHKAQAGINETGLGAKVGRIVQVRQREDRDPDGDPERAHGDGVNLVPVGPDRHFRGLYIIIISIRNQHCEKEEDPRLSIRVVPRRN